MSAKDSTITVEAVVGGFPPILGTPEGFQKLNGQFLGFIEIVKLTGRGKLINQSQWCM